ncbi:MAG: hypothetical protein ACRYG8_13430 [Janthinobacterium lividum]
MSSCNPIHRDSFNGQGQGEPDRHVATLAVGVPSCVSALFARRRSKPTSNASRRRWRSSASAAHPRHRIQCNAHCAVARIQDGAAEREHEVQVFGVAYTRTL